MDTGWSLPSCTDEGLAENGVMPYRASRFVPRGDLVAFHSLTGNTRALATRIRDVADARLEEIVEPHPRAGFPGEARAMFDSLLRRAPPIAPAACDPERFDTLFLGGPVWGGRIAAPVRTYAKRYGVRANRLCLFCTYDSDGAFDALQELADLCGRRPQAMLAVPAYALVSGGHEQQLQRFLADAHAVRPPAAGHRPGWAAHAA